MSFCRLRHVISGYWSIAQEFSHQSTVKDIKLLSKVVTDLGRSKCWLSLVELLLSKSTTT